jgi:hypothetical protein
VANFANGETQKFFLDGALLRPKIVLLTETDSKNDYAMDEMSFGVCNVDMFRTIKLYLSNETAVTAKWSLNYVKFPKKSNVSQYTTTKWEEENNNKVDDPDVFEFSMSNVSPNQPKSNDCREPCAARVCLCARCPRDSTCLRCLKTPRRESFCLKPSWLTSDQSRTCSTSPSSASPSKTASPATSSSRARAPTRKTTTDCRLSIISSEKSRRCEG